MIVRARSQTQVIAHVQRLLRHQAETRLERDLARALAEQRERPGDGERSNRLLHPARVMDAGSERLRRREVIEPADRAIRGRALPARARRLREHRQHREAPELPGELGIAREPGVVVIDRAARTPGPRGPAQRVFVPARRIREADLAPEQDPAAAEQRARRGDLVLAGSGLDAADQRSEPARAQHAGRVALEEPRECGARIATSSGDITERRASFQRRSFMCGARGAPVMRSPACSRRVAPDARHRTTANRRAVTSVPLTSRAK